MLQKIKQVSLKVVPGLVAIALVLVSSGATNAATVTVPLVGNARTATSGEITNIGAAIDAGTTIPGRGNPQDLLTTGWNVNSNRDLTEGFHEFAIVTWAAVDIPACAASVRTKIDTTIERRTMDVTTTQDNIEWSNFLIRGGPANPEDYYAGARNVENRWKTNTYGGDNPVGHDVPANQAGNYLIPNASSSVDTTYLTRADLASGNLFSGIWLDTYSDGNGSGPENISWFVKINSAEVTYDNTACGPTTPTDPTQPTNPSTTQPKPNSPKTGNLAVATLVTVTLIAATLFAAKVAKTKLHKNAKSAK